MKPAKLILIRGLPGSGKSTRAKEIMYDGLADYHYEADMYMMKEGIYKYDPGELKAAHLWCFTNTVVKLCEGHNVVVSNTFVQMWQMERYLELEELFGIEVEVEICDGQWDSIHDVPDYAINKMQRIWEDLD